MNIVTQKEREPISSIDILNVINTRIIKYEDLRKFRRLDDLFINDSFVILIPNPKKNDSVGHWVCVVRRGDVVSYFDSYGRLPDNKIYLNGSFPYLSKLLIESPYTLEYNDDDYQSNNSATCGRHVIVRIIMKNRSIEDYDTFMKSFKNDDALVTAITAMI